MAIKVQDYLDAAEKPSIELDGKVYVAKDLTVRSASQAIHTIGKADLSTEDGINQTIEVLDSLGLPGKKLVDLPLGVFTAVMEDFFTEAMAPPKKKRKK